MILTIDQLVKELDELRNHKQIVATSGGFDPIHIGHIRCIQESASIATPSSFTDVILVVIVNGDGFLTRKKGKPFMLHEERMQIIDALRGVDYVTGWDDGSQTVVGALELLRPHVFTKGGDRSVASNVPEVAVCEKIGCRIAYGLGGTDKVQSSSDLIKNSTK
jgi:cytidyltransferase-like protein